MVKPKVLMLGEVVYARESYDALTDIAELIEPKASTRDEFIKECKNGDLDGVVAIYRSIQAMKVSGRMDEELVQALPKTVKFVCHNGAGYDQIDIAPCTARHIRVSNVPTAVDDATADTAMFLILGALRSFNPSMLSLREGKWMGDPPPRLGHDPEGKTLGILGMGGIGRNLKKKAEAFGMKVIYHNRKRLSEELAGGAEYVEFEELLQTSDVLSLSLPLNKNTRHIISTKEFEMMKKGIVIINTARGAVMNEAALVQALDNGQVWSCGLDVYEDEPEIHPRLIANRDVMLLPHMGTRTVETGKAMEEWCISNVRAALETGKLRSPVPEQADM